MTAKRNIIGLRSDKLVVIAEHSKSVCYFNWLCRCDCGTEVVRAGPSLLRGAATSCGCKKKIPNDGHFQRRHGSSKSREYSSWSTIKQRTTNPKATGYDRYGGAGITMHKEWSESFETFLRDVGYAPTERHSIDRIDNSGNYEPGNVRWATFTEQNRNRRNAVYATVGEKTKTISEWCEIYGVPYAPTFQRIRYYGWDPLRALTEPILSRGLAPLA